MDITSLKNQSFFVSMRSTQLYSFCIFFLIVHFMPAGNYVSNLYMQTLPRKAAYTKPCSYLCLSWPTGPAHLYYPFRTASFITKMLTETSLPHMTVTTPRQRMWPIWQSILLPLNLFFIHMHPFPKILNTIYYWIQEIGLIPKSG